MNQARSARTQRGSAHEAATQRCCIGVNELDAIEVCDGYVEAQDDYAVQQRKLYDLNQYAQRIISSPCKQDGLAWQKLRRELGWSGGRKHRPSEQGHTNSSNPYHGCFLIVKGKGRRRRSAKWSVL